MPPRGPSVRESPNRRWRVRQGGPGDAVDRRASGLWWLFQAHRAKRKLRKIDDREFRDETAEDSAGCCGSGRKLRTMIVITTAMTPSVNVSRRRGSSPPRVF